ncbi:putative transcription factor Nin-like family [Helianthus annuus]|nr:protein NLP7 [Helianthus annuus]KAJ0566068.1 putative transcription factor Nin-like family [Helianthus annuus]KAJ0572909.1 putative transcription factor Nin-like family [Helianthus annuus]
MDQVIMEMLWNKIYLEQPTVQLSGDSRYLNPLWVSGKQDEPSQSITTCFELRTERFYSYHQEITYKIRAALKILTFREQHVLVQFWSPRDVGKHQLLTTIDQPFGLGVASEELCSYRRDSEHKAFLVDKDHEEEDVSPPARVFRRGLPEWTSDITDYETKDFPQQDCAIRCNLHGYLALPVFDSTTRSCVGVLEILTSVKYMHYAFEVQQVHKALQAENLTSPQVFDYPTLKVPSERKQTERDKILDILKVVCDIHSLPLAQTWTVSPTSSYVSHNKVIEKTCSSFDTRCVGKVCMSTAALPFHVRDLGMWHFRKACGEQHLDKARGFVGKALLDRRSYYCQDVTELSEEEYPLVHYARMNGLTSCFTIFLHSVEGDDGDDYVLEFFLQLGNKDSRHVVNLVQTLKQRIEIASGFELGEILLPVEVTDQPPRDVSCLSLSTNPHIIPISSTTSANALTPETDSSDAESLSANVAKTDPANVPSQQSPKQIQPNKHECIITDNVSMQKTKQSRKRKIDSLTMETVNQHVGKPLGQTAEILGVSRSTLKRFCRVHGISSWPVPKHSKRSEFGSEKQLQQSSMHSVGHVSDTGLLTVKASFKDDMIKFPFCVSSGLMELEKEVAERVDVKGQRLSLKYEDEEKDWVLITCDADLESLASNTAIKLLVYVADDDRLAYETSH